MMSYLPLIFIIEFQNREKSKHLYLLSTSVLGYESKFDDVNEYNEVMVTILFLQNVIETLVDIAF